MSAISTWAHKGANKQLDPRCLRAGRRKGGEMGDSTECQLYPKTGRCTHHPRKNVKEDHDDMPKKAQEKAPPTKCPPQTEESGEQGRVKRPLLGNSKHQERENAELGVVVWRPSPPERLRVRGEDVARAMRLRMPPGQFAKGTAVTVQPWPGAPVPMCHFSPEWARSFNSERVC